MPSPTFEKLLQSERVKDVNVDRTSLEFAEHLDATDPLRRFRNEFFIPSKADLKDQHPEAKPLEQQNGSPTLSSRLPSP